MADYFPLIARAVDGLGTSTGEARRAMYERARSALVSQLRSIDPPLSEADITRERLALEDAIRKVEAESVRKARQAPIGPASAPLSRPAPPAGKPTPPLPPRPERPVPPPPSPRPEAGRPMPPRPEAGRPPPPPPPPAAPRPAAAFGAADQARGMEPQSARSRLLGARTSPVSREGMRSFRNVVDEVEDLGTASAASAQSARDTRDTYSAAPPFSGGEEPPAAERIEPRFDMEAGEEVLSDEAPESIEPAYDFEDEAPPPFIRPQQARARDAEEHYEPRPPRSYRGLAKLLIVLIVLAGAVATVSWQWSNIAGLYGRFSRPHEHPAPTAQAPAEPKFSGRVPQEQAPGQSSTAQGQNVPAVAQRVVLIEEDPNNPAGRQFVGSAVWRTETVSPGSGLAPELEVRADITIPDRKMAVTWTLRRNTDQALPASHTIEIMFNLPPDFPGGGVANVPGVLLKDSEQARGIPLAGLAVKVTNGFFLIGLSAVDTDVQRNMDLLKTKPWFDIPIVYNNGGRAILAMEKGPPGDRAFADAFAAWGK